MEESLERDCGQRTKGRRALVIAVVASLSVLALVVGGVIVLVTHLRSTETGPDTTSSNLSVDSDRSAQRDFGSEEHRAVLRMSLQELMGVVDQIRKDIDSLQEEMDTFERIRARMISENAAPLTDEMAGAFSLNDPGAVLPGPEWVKQSRRRLDVLVLPVKAALSNNQVFQVSTDSVDEIRLVQQEVRKAKNAYATRRRLLEALAPGNGGSTMKGALRSDGTRPKGAQPAGKEIEEREERRPSSPKTGKSSE